ncbi:MAG: Gfo/Idh/MocA family oxidoreductase [Verrucomicrobia bacterium]|nr:Gfo/Idh/MocA family oxidoreductase [Verrucomicrobiota bacterium]
MNKLRIGLVGCGPIAQNAHLPAIEKARDIHLQAIADTDAALRESVSLRYHAESTYKHSDEIFADPKVDLVILAVSDRLHVPLAKDAVRAGKHVLVEKPLGVSTEECENLRLLVPPDRVFAIGCNRRFLPGVRAAKAFASRSLSIASYSAFYYDSTFRHGVTQPNLFPLEIANSGEVMKSAGTDWKSTNRLIYNLLTHSPHLLDLAGYLVGPIERVRAIHRERDISQSATESRIVSHVWHVDVTFVARRGEIEGASGHFELVLPRHGEFAEGFKLETNLGRALVEYPYVWFQREERVEIYDAAAKVLFRPDSQDANTFRLQLESLADAILHGRPLVNANLEDGIAAVKAMVAIAHSARHGGDWVRVEDVEGDLEHSVLNRSEPATSRCIASHEQEHIKDRALVHG